MTECGVPTSFVGRESGTHHKRQALTRAARVTSTVDVADIWLLHPSQYFYMQQGKTR
jgi:hypothetical protein